MQIFWDEGSNSQDALDYKEGRAKACALELSYSDTCFSQTGYLNVLVLAMVSKGVFRRVGLCQIEVETIGRKVRQNPEGLWNYARAQVLISTPNLSADHYESTRIVQDLDWLDWRESNEVKNDQCRWLSGKPVKDGGMNETRSSMPNGKEQVTEPPISNDPSLEVLNGMEFGKKESSTEILDTVIDVLVDLGFVSRQSKTAHGAQGQDVQVYTFTII